MGKFPMDRTRWQTGLTLDVFVNGMQTHQAAIQHRLREVTLPEADRADFARLTSLIRALVMTEDWCGDGVMNLPILARIVEAAPGMEMRVFIRSQAPDLNDHYVTCGITHIPVFTFLDADFHEIGTWVERPQAAHDRVKAWLAAHPEVDAISGDPALTDEERQAKLRAIGEGMLTEMEGWYADGLQQATVEELKSLLTGG
jgi:hypothetical protein